MVSTLILTHGGLARELVEAAEMILGRQPKFDRYVRRDPLQCGGQLPQNR